MHPTSVGQPRVNERHRIIQAPTDSGCQPLSELAYVALGWESQISQLEPGTAIDEHPVRAVDQDICHPGQVKQWLQQASAHAVPPQRLYGLEYG
jgi:hypothetical protein